MIKTPRAGTGSLVIGLVVAAIAAGSAAATGPAYWIDLHARLAPVVGTNAAGKFGGVLRSTGGHTTTVVGNWQLAWSLSLPQLDGPITATLRISSARSRVLCTGCSTKASGTTTLTAHQVTRISKSHAVVVVRTHSARLRGPVKAFLHIPTPPKS
jgi:hypothetical protein